MTAKTPLLQLTIQHRLSLLFAASAVVVLLALSVFIYYFTYNYRRTEFKQRMLVRLQEADSLLRKNTAYPFMTLEQMPPGTLPEEKFFYRSVANTINLPIDGENVSLLLEQTQTAEPYYFIQKGKREFLIYPDPQLNHLVVVSAVDVFGYTKLQHLRRLLVAGVLLGTLAMGFISWYWPRKELQPIREKIKKANAISAQNLSLRLNVRNNWDELGQLAITFNQMLDRIEKGFAVQKQFISNAAHELRNPITAIWGHAQLALRQSRTVDEYTDVIKNIQQKAADLQKIVERLLLLSRMEAGTDGLKKETVTLDEVLFDAVAAVQHRVVENKVPIQVQMDERAEQSFSVLGDAVMLGVAFQNLIENAVKYGAEKPVQVVLHAGEKKVVVFVKDGGAGMGEALQHLYQPFFRTASVRHIPGTGIGLTLVKRIMDWHHWEIEFSNNHPSGTLVTVTAPHHQPNS